MAEAIPSQEKLKVIAQWLGVEAGWLRFGIGNPETEPQEYAESLDYLLMRAIADLSAQHQQVVRDLVKSLHKIEMESLSNQNSF